MSSGADREYVPKHMNLAQKISDGSKVYIPAIEESEVVIQSNSIDASPSTIGLDTGLINVNSATSEQLDTLPKVGPVTAQKIISGRPYGNISELLSKKILGQKAFDMLKDKIVAE